MRINSKKCPICSAKLIGHLHNSYDPELKETITDVTLECEVCKKEIDISDYYETSNLKKEINGSFRRITKNLGRDVQQH
mgnify:CR=1 FL=1|tara:strand:- start:5141 stop:5377 length:237 start_codon:yes stop_codon:yes gene_type:complete